MRWLGSVSWRWRLTHFVGAIALELFGIWYAGRGGLGAWTYAWRELTQYGGPGRKPIEWHVLDWIPALLATVIIATWRS